MSLKVSIITVCYNSEATIEETIRSVLEQDYPHVEFIIIDGRSSDRTLAIIDKYKSGIAQVVSEKDKGYYDAANKGVNLCTGDVVGFLNSDDFYTGKSVLSHVMDTFAQKKVDSVYGDLLLVNRENPDKIIRYWKSEPYRPGMFGLGWMPPHPTFFVKRACYLKYGNYIPDFRFSGDYELMLRFIHKNRISTCYIPETLVKMRMGGFGNISLRAKLRANREDRLAWKMNGLNPGLLTFLRKPLSKISQFFKKPA